ncbi:Nif3-like dinuclear metal center hexameric protein [Helicobacter didelphidarum]|uniref:GTP cyclohydrolase 1 type 2 homolog n=1 Tax=Helicobacter didelphidarum TaxID=2040648 RepID=A0A3D8IHW1_9HELI|nr:Nif3-like dinuclear metal center hexameric protein [Helicobacter didelphidarum]
MREIYEILNTISPFELQAKWDNSGLNVGSLESCFQHLYIALEIDWQVIDSMQQDSLLITHHPLIFKPLQNFQINSYPCNLIAACIKKNIAVISMHTNFDITHLNQAFATKLELEKLGFAHTQTQDFSIIYMHKKQEQTSIESLAHSLKKTLNISFLRYSKATDFINNIYLTCGSNASSYIIANKNDCIITGDIKYHDAMIANSLGINFIEIGHFESECIFASLVAKILQKNDIQAIILNSHNPFKYLGESQ